MCVIEAHRTLIARDQIPVGLGQFGYGLRLVEGGVCFLHCRLNDCSDLEVRVEFYFVLMLPGSIIIGANMD